MQVVPTKSSGFSLIEMTVILSIVALVLGGIWTAAADYRRKQIITHLVTDITGTTIAIKRLFPPSTYTGAYTNIGDTVYKAGLFPANWTWRSTSPAGFISPDGTYVSVSQSSSNYLTIDVNFDLATWNSALPVQYCQEVLHALARKLQSANLGLFYVHMVGAAQPFVMSPFSLTDFSGCSTYNHFFLYPY